MISRDSVQGGLHRDDAILEARKTPRKALEIVLRREPLQIHLRCLQAIYLRFSCSIVMGSGGIGIIASSASAIPMPANDRL